MMYLVAVIWILIGIVVFLKEAIMPAVGSAFITFLAIVFILGSFWMVGSLAAYFETPVGFAFGMSLVVFAICVFITLLKPDEDVLDNMWGILGLVMIPITVITGVFDIFVHTSGKAMVLVTVLPIVDFLGYLFWQDRKVRIEEKARIEEPIQKNLRIARRLLWAMHEDEIKAQFQSQLPSDDEMVSIASCMRLPTDLSLLSNDDRMRIIKDWRSIQVCTKLIELCDEKLPDKDAVEKFLADYDYSALPDETNNEKPPELDEHKEADHDRK